MRWNRMALPVLVAALLLGACGGDKTPSGAATTPPATSPTPSPEGSTKLVYSTSIACPSSVCAEGNFPAAEANDLFLYDVDLNIPTRLTSDGDDTVETLPQFTPEGKVSFVEGTGEGKPGAALFELPQSGGNAQELFRVTGGDSVFRYDWKPDGSAVAFLSFKDQRSSLKIWTRADGKIATVKSFPELLGRGVGSTDEVAVAWSPNGQMLLVVDTFRSPPLETTMWVLRPNGSDVVPARDGTFARWAPDSASIIYRGWEKTQGWQRLTVSDGKTASLPIPEGRFLPVLSQDGTDIAYYAEGDAPAVYVFDLAAGKERKVGAGVVPLWLSDSTLLVTSVRACRANDECFDREWVPVGSAAILRVNGGEPTTIEGWTLNADVRLP